VAQVNAHAFAKDSSVNDISTLGPTLTQHITHIT